MKKRIIVTGGAGFIGSNLCDYLLNKGNEIICIDNFDDYYPCEQKQNNLKQALKNPNFTFIKEDIKKTNKLAELLTGKFNAIIHLAAKAGVRYSIKNPIGYEEINVQGTKSILELAVRKNIQQFVFASSSSIYGNAPTPFDENFKELKPISPYAQTKLLSEKIGKEYSEKYNLNFISLRFFSVYGPGLRPDLVMNKIANGLFKNENLKVFGNGNTARDYTYVDDIIFGIEKALDYKNTNFEVFNLGSGNPIKLYEIINIFEKETGKKLKIENIAPINGESEITWANNKKASELLNFQATINIEQGIKKYLTWYKSHCL
ncbi:MAG: GDP-mannose 4,6-dehydratase [Bacteroidales bacterium]|nr:GDP-mannose 4,6-dehydratase [Bacteroidales bacterium]